MTHPMFADDMREILDSFVVETKEIFEKLDTDLVDLEQRPGDKELLNQIFRAVHTVKGTAGFLSFDQMSRLAHRFEDVLNKLRRDEIAFQPSMMDVMLAAFDLMKVLLQQVVDEDLEEIDLEGILEQLEQIATGAEFSGRAPAKPDQPSVSKPESSAAAGERRETGPEESAGRSRAERQADPTIRVEVARLDNLMNLVGELVLGRNRLAQIVAGLPDHYGDDISAAMQDANSQIDFITTELQSAVMKTRMVPIGRIFSRFPRVVRDLAREFSKEIELVTEGEETEMDKSVIEEIADPLVHLIRNAADHGIEAPADRRAAGKNERGRIRLTAAHEGNHVVVEIADDGHGIDPEKIRAKAVEKGLISQEEADGLSRPELYNLVFLPGFSTAQRVSNISGRGVGMDVVKTNITRLNGTVSISSEVGVGTRFTIRLPLTLAIIQGLLVEVGQETFALPLHSVLEVVRVDRQEVTTINGREVIRLRERVLPIVHVQDMFGDLFTGEDRAVTDRFYAVVIGVGHHTFGVVVDRLLGQKEIVIKPLGEYLRNVPGVAGSTILGDGRVIMILDPGQIVELLQKALTLHSPSAVHDASTGAS